MASNALLRLHLRMYRYSNLSKQCLVHFQYFEIGRVEALKKVGLSYRSIEESGIMLPVKDLNIQYKKAAKYDDLIRVETTIPEMPTNRIKFNYRILRKEEVLATGSTTLFFMDKVSEKPIRPSKDFLNRLSPYFN